MVRCVRQDKEPIDLLVRDWKNSRAYCLEPSAPFTLLAVDLAAEETMVV